MKKKDELLDPNSCFNKAGPEDILFILVQKDRAAPGAIRDWCQRRIDLSLNRHGDAKITEAQECAANIEAFHQPQDHELFDAAWKLTHQVHELSPSMRQQAAELLASHYLRTREMANKKS